MAADNSRRFRTAAPHYLAGRPPYADLLIRRVSALARLGTGDAVLDLGCGPGQLAYAFAPAVGRVVAMDPEPEMLAAARSATGTRNIRFIQGGSNDLSPALGQFRLVVMGRSFHWMDRAETLRRLDSLIVHGGAVALFDTSHPAVPDNGWVQHYSALRRSFGTDDHPSHGPGWLRHELMLLDSPFRQVEELSVFDRRTFPADQLLDRAFSMSSTARHRLGEERAGMLAREIKALVAEIAPEGTLTEVVVSHALLGWRPGEEP